MGSTPPLELFLKSSATLRKAKLRHQDFRCLVARAVEGSFIYADPPDFTATERTFVECGKRPFERRDLQDLINGLQAAESRGAEIALAYSDGIPVGEPNDWVQTRFQVTRNVGGLSGSRKKNADILNPRRGISHQAPRRDFDFNETIVQIHTIAFDMGRRL